MQRVDSPEILDSDACSPADVEISMRDLGRVNRWFGGVATTQKMVQRVAQATGVKRFSLLEVAAGSGELPQAVRRRLHRRGITLDVTLLDRSRLHLPKISNPLKRREVKNSRASGNRLSQNQSVVADAMVLPFADEAFDLLSCNLFAHHLDAQQLASFVREALRVSRHALLINDLIRHPLHLALAYAGYPIIRSRVAWLDGITSVRRAYTADEMRSLIVGAFDPARAPQIEISSNYLFRMGVIVWKGAV